jgi:FkbM family methyltransferase
MSAVVAVRRARCIRRAGIPSSPMRTLSPRWNRYVADGRFDCLPPGVLVRDHVVVDVGANVGMWTEAALRVLQPARVIAFEPTPASYAALRQRFADRPEVDVRHAAVGDRERTATLHLFSRPEFNSVLPMLDGVPELYGGFGATGMVDVPMTSLDIALADIPHISVLHVDAQGMEPSIMQGAEEVLARTSVVMTVLDFVAHYDTEALHAERSVQMEQFGFRLHSLGAEGHDRDGRLLWAVATYQHV